MFPLPQFLQDLPYTHPTKSFSLNKRNKQQKDIKNIKKIKSSQKYIEFILCLPTKPWHVACVGVWLINPVMLHWAKLTFPLTEVITTANNFKKREREGYTSCQAWKMWPAPSSLSAAQTLPFAWLSSDFDDLLNSTRT